MTIRSPLILSLLSLILVSLASQSATAEGRSTSPLYDLAISFDLEQGIVIGTARIEIAPGESLTLGADQLTITRIRLKRQEDGALQQKLVAGPRLVIPASSKEQSLSLTYRYQPADDTENRITPEAITLLSGWYPRPLKKMHYRLSARLPAEFQAISEADRFPLPRSGDTVSAQFSQPLHALHFIAAPYRHDQLIVRDNLIVHTLFFPEDTDLASHYLERARDYLLRYEDEIGPYPYHHFVIVANQLPTGFGMPTFTLLGRRVLRLPFITETSLGHEVLHSWFGNSVGVADGSGNWCEGLTAYLADHAYRGDDSLAYRYEALENYLSYINDTNVIPLADFVDASHHQPDAKAIRAVGYSRAMMLFHELHQWLGPERFMAGIRQFYQRFRGDEASWNDLQQVFGEIADDLLLTEFFNERLHRTDLPAIAARDITIDQRPAGNTLRFTLIQKNESPSTLRVPVVVDLSSGSRRFMVETSESETEVTLDLPGRPLRFALDPELSMFRAPGPDERRGVWSGFLGSTSPLAIVGSEQTKAIYQPLLDVLELDGDVRLGDQVTNGDLIGKDLLLLGPNQRAVKNLFADPGLSPEGFVLQVRDNPLSPDHVAVLVSSSGPDETALVAHRLSHYGKYGFLHFVNGRPVQKSIPEHDHGILYPLEELPTGIATSRVTPFDRLVQKLAANDVIYVGEAHTSLSDHRLQLRIVEALADRNIPVAIGMEMFPAASQQPLDDYILLDPDMTERDFLRRSHYFRVWKFDFRYYREILTLARQHRIPVIGLNLSRDIVSTVYQKGTTDALEPEVADHLVQDRDLDLPGYRDRLTFMHQIHQLEGHGQGKVSGFLQAQALWDETMAANIVRQLHKRPDHKLVILAGNEHTRKDSGIPPRVARRLAGVKQAVIRNIGENEPPADSGLVADYLFFSEALELSPAPKIGIMLKEGKEEGEGLVIADFVKESHAPEAGLKKGDKLLSIDAFPVTSMEDVRIAMADPRLQKSVELVVQRTSGTKNVSISATVPLIRIEDNPHHPKQNR